MSLGLGMVLGVLLGSIPFPVPVLGSIKVGVAGGSLVMALILGKLGRTGPLTWTMPLSANLTLRNFGLSIFLAQVGMSSGAPFVKTVASQGPILLVAGAAMLLVLALTPLLVGHFVMRIPFGDLLGVTAGVTGNPAILAYAFRSYPSDRVEICYAMIFPAATIVKIVIAQVLIAAGGRVGGLQLRNAEMQNAECRPQDAALLHSSFFILHSLLHRRPERDERLVEVVHADQAEARELEVEDHVHRHRHHGREDDRVQPRPHRRASHSVAREQGGRDGQHEQQPEDDVRRVHLRRHVARRRDVEHRVERGQQQHRRRRVGAGGVDRGDRLPPDLATAARSRGRAPLRRPRMSGIFW